MALCYERFPLIPVPRTLLPRIVLFGDIIFVASLEVQTHYQINCATRELSLPAKFEDLNVPSIALYLEAIRFTQFDATTANPIIHYISESLGPFPRYYPP
jgi:hypothetical protein